MRDEIGSKMATDDERRRVAAALRTCTPTISYKSSEGGGWAHLCDIATAVGLTREKDPSAWGLAQRLADLIEPSCDRERLLRLAGKVFEDTEEDMRAPGESVPTFIAGQCLRDVTRRIREACGEES